MLYEVITNEIPYFDDITVVEFSAQTGEGVEEIRAIIEDIACDDEVNSEKE